MAYGTVKMNAADIIGRTTIHVELAGVRRAMWRLKIVVVLIRFAAWIGGFRGMTHVVKLRNTKGDDDAE